MAILLFGLQLLASLVVYIYFAHYYPVSITILVAMAETALAMWVFSVINRTPRKEEPALKEIPQEKVILRTIPRRKKVRI